MPSGADDFSIDTLATNWAIQTGQSTGTVAGGVWNAADIFDNCGHYRTAESYGGDHFSQATAPQDFAGDREASVRVRAQAGAETYYAGGVENSALGSQGYRIWKMVAGTATSLSLHGSQVMLAGDVVRLTIIGTNLSLVVNSVEILTASDPDLSGGAPGLGAYGASSPQARWNDWSAADIGGASPTTVPSRRLRGVGR